MTAKLIANYIVMLMWLTTETLMMQLKCEFNKQGASTIQNWWKFNSYFQKHSHVISYAAS